MPALRPLLRESTILGALGALLVSLSAAPASALDLSTEAAADFNKTVLASNLGAPVDVAELPDGRVVVIEKGGNVKTFTPGMDDPATDEIQIIANAPNEQGLLGVVADPAFATNQYIYFYASVDTSKANRHQVRRYKLGADGKLSDPKPVIDMGLSGDNNHNGGGITIYDGNLFVGVGDTGLNPIGETIPRNHIASCLNWANGKVLRVSLAEATLGQPVADNPLMSAGNVTGCKSSSSSDDTMFGSEPAEKRIYAWGFRNPFRIWADPVTGKVWVGDVGEATREEISIVEKGKHYGYPFEEGTKKYTKAEQSYQPDSTCMGMTPAAPCTPPILDYGTKDAPGKGSVMGGRILDGCGWPEAWKSRYLFGDYEQGKAWYIDINEARDGIKEGATRKEFGNTNGLTAMRMGTDNALYIVEAGAGTVTRVTAKAAPEATPGSCLTTNPAPGGANGGGGSGGASSGGSGNGGAATGGTSPGTAGGSTGGSSSTAGAGNPSGGSNNPGTGGSTSAAGAGGGSSDDSGGCGCRVTSSRSSAALTLAALAAAAGMVFGRRRSRQG